MHEVERSEENPGNEARLFWNNTMLSWESGIEVRLS